MFIALQNEGATPVPDMYGREGSHFLALPPDTWTPVVWEIGNLSRDRVTGLTLAYYQRGLPAGAAPTGELEICGLELQRVEADQWEGWQVAPGGISFSHTGYRPGLPKLAIAAPEVRQFTIRRAGADETVYAGSAEARETPLGPYRTLDFTSLTEAGEYCIEVEGQRTGSFHIGPDVWTGAVGKILNFLYCERCGASVPGIHGPCHGDLVCEHGGRRIIVNGGWHDAGDLSQMIAHTAPLVGALFDLARYVGPSEGKLYGRLIEEARWGLDYVLKTRFGDGYRAVDRPTGEWTDGIIGTADDRTYEAANTPFENFAAAAAETAAWRALVETDATCAATCLQAAEEDWRFALAQVHRLNVDISGVGGWASADLYAATRCEEYLTKAAEFAQVVVDSQEKAWPDWDIPLTGFLYSDPERTQVLRYNPRSQMHLPIMALARLCELAPDHPRWMEWYGTVARYAEYLKSAATFTAPYGMIPSSIYAEDEEFRPGLYSNQENLHKYEEYERRAPQYAEQVRNGIRLGEKHFLRRFPVWYGHRGNHGIILSEGKALSTAAHLRRDLEALSLAQDQLEWVVGRNPFCQSTMYGEGYDFAPLYSPCSGHMVGSLPVGISTRGNRDAPYWPPSTCYNYKEAWVDPVSRWLWMTADLHGQAVLCVEGVPRGESSVRLERAGGEEGATCQIDAASGRLEAALPEGEYAVRTGGVERRVVLLPGRVERVDLRRTVALEVTQTTHGSRARIQVRAAGEGDADFEVRASNLEIQQARKGARLEAGSPATLTWEADVVAANSPWVAVVVVNGDVEQRQEVSHFAIPRRP